MAELNAKLGPALEAKLMYYRAFQRFRRRISLIRVDHFSKATIQMLINESLLRELDEFLPASVEES